MTTCWACRREVAPTIALRVLPMPGGQKYLAVTPDGAALLGPVQTRLIWGLLAQPGGLRMNELIDVAYGDREDGGPDFASQSIRTMICILGGKLRALGWRLAMESSRPEGGRYRLEAIGE